jgi:ABC-2 type transport system permease protein
MNAVANDVPRTPAPAGPLNSPFTWLLRREFWESRAIWIAPAICAAILIFSTAIGGLKLGDIQFAAAASPEVIDKVTKIGAEGVARLAGLLLLALAVPFYITLTFTQFFYAIDALYDERRDRSILFWKSLPVSDQATVLSKLTTACVVIPAVALLGTIIGQFAVYAVITMKLSGTGLPYLGQLWLPSTWFPALVSTVYGMVAVMIWSVPVVGWALLVSALSPRSPFLWATLPPMAVALAERVAFGTNYVATFLRDQALGFIPAAFSGFRGDGLSVRVGEHGDGPPTVLSLMQPMQFLADPNVWGGLIVGAALIAGAIWARRYREEA